VKLPIGVAVCLVALVIGGSEAPATIEAQRARLPPAAECASPVAGRWKALAFFEIQNTWYEYTLEIREDPKDPTILTGTIFVDSWAGPADRIEPPEPCIARDKGKMEGHGSFVNGNVTFAGGEYHVTEHVCGPRYGYNPDQFTGRLEPERQEFQSVNNDGGVAVNEPMVFRRIGCFENGRKDPGSNVTPPPFFPKRKAAGC